MKKIHTFIAFLFSLMLIGPAFGQISFSDESSLLANPNVRSGVAIGVADLNADGLDDIIRMDDGNQLYVEYQSPDGQPFTSLEVGSTQGAPWAVVAGDADNDGFCDLMYGGAYNNIKVAMNIGGDAFGVDVVGNSNIFVQGSNFADINNDGYLDIFACHDDAESRIYEGDGTGLFTSADSWIDMATVPASDNSGNYGSVWTDFDNDRDLDLYIAKCRIGVGNPEDPRRINALFTNDGGNNYTEEADRFGLKIKHQSWTADFGDIDNDGDLDCFVTNHDHTLQVLENDGAGYFTDISSESGVADVPVDNYVQGIMRDLDNDGFLDLIVSQPAVFFRNNGDKTFTQIFPGTESFGSVAAGDLNNDGFVDLFVSSQNGFNSPSNTPDQLWMNEGNDNHHLCVTLEGVESNRSGIGARVEIHGSWGIQVREVRAGESYGITNSLTKYFGLGEATVVDYLIVYWPSGQVDVLKDVPADGECLKIVEGTSCLLADFELEMDGDEILCQNETLTLTAPDGYNYFWNNGSNAPSLTVEETGSYSLLIVDDQGCAAFSGVVHVVESPDETPSIEAFGDTEFCEGGDVVLISSEADSYLWSNGEMSENIIVNETGEYYVTVPGACGEFTSEVVNVEVYPNAAMPSANDETIIEGNTATLTATGNNVHWYDSEAATEPLAIGNVYETVPLFNETTYYLEDVSANGGGDFSAGLAAHQGSQFNGPTFNGQIIFDAFQTFTITEVKVNADIPGLREVQLLDADDNVLQSAQFDLGVGDNFLTLNFLVEAGEDYKLTTNGSVNQATLGTNSPRLERNEVGVNYPYEVPGILSMKNSNFGIGFYYYFYDWKIKLPTVDCPSERASVTVFVEPNSLNEALPYGELTVKPNPSNGQFLLSLTAVESGEARLRITDFRGREIFTENFEAVQGVEQNREIDLGEIPAGVYFLKVTSGERAAWSKLVIDSH